MVFRTWLINDEYTHYLISNVNLLVCSKNVTQIGLYISMEHLNTINIGRYHRD